jgi:hypothetical protein
MMADKKPGTKRARPFDHRKLPEIRAHLEVSRKHGLQFPLNIGFQIFWDCSGDWNRVDQWFQDPKVQSQNADMYAVINARMQDNRGVLDQLFEEAFALYQQYSTPPTDRVQ